MKKKICIIGPNKDMFGGIATVLKQYSESYLNDLYDITFISSYSKNKFEFFKGLTKYIYIKKNIQLCHIHTASNGSFIRKIIFSFITPNHIPICLHIHGGGFFEFYNDSNIILKWLIKKTLSKACKIIVVSEYFKRNIIKVFNIKEDKVITIHNGIDIKENQVNLNRKKKQVLYLGKLIKSKGVYELIKIISKVHYQSPNIKFIIAGDGEVNKVKEIINKLKLNNCTEVLGWIEGEQKKKILEESSILVVPSHFESFGISIVEAMARGLAIVANDIGGIPDIVLDKLNGKLIKNNDIERFKEEIIFYVKNDKARNEVAKNNLKRCFKFDVNNMIDQIDNLYEEILK